MDHYVPMTPELRRGAIASIDEKIREIKTCEDTPWTNMYLNAYEIQKTLINALPDGYPVPVRDRTR